MKTNELVLNATVVPGKIDLDLTETKNFATQIAEVYSNMVYDTSEEKIKDTLKEMRDDRARLNKLVEGLDTKRKEIKNAFLVPLTQFEDELKSITKVIDTSKAVIDSKVKEVEEAGREAKRRAIRAYYDAVSTDVEPAFKDTLFAKIYNKSWENATASKKSYVDAIDSAITSYLHGLEVLSRYEKYRDEGIEVFKLTLDLAKAQETIYLKEQEEKRIIERERARLEAEAAAKLKAQEQAIREQEKIRVLSQISQSTIEIPVEKTSTVVDKDNNVIAIRLLSGAITEVYTPLALSGTKVVILDEDVADQREVFDFMNKIDGLVNVY